MLIVISAKSSELSVITGCPQPDGGRGALISSAKTIFMVSVLTRGRRLAALSEQ
jgi:hypothetical protein